LDYGTDFSYSDGVITIVWEDPLSLPDVDMGMEKLEENQTIYVTILAEPHNEYHYYHDFTQNLITNTFTFNNWATTQAEEGALIPNFESNYFLFNSTRNSIYANGKVEQITSLLNETNALVFNVPEEMDDSDYGWSNYKALFMRMGVFNLDVVKYIDVSFIINLDTELYSYLVYPEFIDSDTGEVKITLPAGDELLYFNRSNSARIQFKPVFMSESDFEGNYYEYGLPYIQRLEWDSDSLVDECLSLDLDYLVHPDNSEVIILNELFDNIFNITNIGEYTETINPYSNSPKYEITINNVSISEFYEDENGNLLHIDHGNAIFLKYNISIDKAMALTIGEMVLQNKNYISYDGGNVPGAEIALLGNYTIDDLYSDRSSVVAWESSIDITPFVDEFSNTFKTEIFDINFTEIAPEFFVDNFLYITDVLITSNDPRYTLTIDSLYIVELTDNYNFTDSIYRSFYPNTHIEEFYIGNYSSIYNSTDPYSSYIVNTTGVSGAIVDNPQYFDVWDSRGSLYFTEWHLLVDEESADIFNFTWNPAHDIFNSGMNIYDPNPYPDRYRYLYISYADADSYKEWRTIDAYNISADSIKIYYSIEEDGEWTDIYLNRTEGEFEVKQCAVEVFYPYNIDNTSHEFTLSNDYSIVESPQVSSVQGLLYNMDNVTLNSVFNGESITISHPSMLLSQFETIIVVMEYENGAFSDYSTVRLTEQASLNHPDDFGNKNTTLYIEFDYSDWNFDIIFGESYLGEDTEFEYFEYIRNDDYGIIKENEDDEELETIYYIDHKDNFMDFEYFSAVEDESQVLEIRDFNLDGKYEYIVERADPNFDGVYEIEKIGFIHDELGLCYHTIIEEYTRVDNFEEKVNDAYETDWFGIFDLFPLQWKIEAKREIITNTTISTQIEKNYVSIKKDVDLDGYIDYSVITDTVNKKVTVETLTTETTHFKGWNYIYEISLQHPFGYAKNYDGEYTTEFTNNTKSPTSSKTTYIYTDFIDNEISEMRIYEDNFPNEMSNRFELSNYEELITNDYGDDDAGNDVQISAPSLAAASSVYYSQDNIPVEYDTNTIIGAGEVNIYNILEESVDLSLPGLYSEFTGINSNEISLNAIKVIPRDGRVIFDSNPLSASPFTDGYYLYYDSNKDGVFETIFVSDNEGNILSVCFDYDSNGLVTPNMMSFIQDEGISWSSNTAEQDLADLITWKSDMKQEFSDALFDLWKIQYTSETSELIIETEGKTADELIGILSGQWVEDLTFQLFAQACGLIGQAISPVPYVGYFIGYFIPNIWRSLRQQHDRRQYIASQTFFNDDYEGEVTLSTGYWEDEWFGGLPTTAMFGNYYGVYAEVKGSTPEHDYSGKVVLAAKGGSKTGLFGTSYLPVMVNYELTMRDYWAYSDNFTVGEVFSRFIYNNYEEEVLTSDIYAVHKDQNIMSLETKVSQQSLYDSKQLNIIIPTTFAGLPVLQFAEKSEDFISLPEFFVDYPIVVSGDTYNSLGQLPDYNGKFSIYKEYTGTNFTEHIPKLAGAGVYVPRSVINIVPIDSPHEIHADLESVHVIVYNFKESISYYIGSDGTLQSDVYDDSDVKDFGELNSGQYTFDGHNLIITKDPYDINGIEPDDTIILKLTFSNYHNIDSDEDISEKYSDEEIALMQWVHASTLEYLYQYNLAAKTEQQMIEIAYTAAITAASVAIMAVGQYAVSKGIAALLPKLGISTSVKAVGSGALARVLEPSMQKLSAPGIIIGAVGEVGEELFVDPFIEAVSTNLVKAAGGSEEAQLIVSHLAESLRESSLDPIARRIHLKKEGVQSFSDFHRMIKKTKHDPNYDFSQLQSDYQDMISKAREQGSHKGRLSKIGKIAGVAFSSIGVFASFLSGISMFASLGPTVASSYIFGSSMCKTEGISVKEWFSHINTEKVSSAISKLKLPEKLKKVSSYLFEHRKMIAYLASFAAFSISMGLLSQVNEFFGAVSHLSFGAGVMISGASLGTYLDKIVIRKELESLYEKKTQQDKVFKDLIEQLRGRRLEFAKKLQRIEFAKLPEISRSKFYKRQIQFLENFALLKDKNADGAFKYQTPILMKKILDLVAIPIGFIPNKITVVATILGINREGFTAEDIDNVLGSLIDYGIITEDSNFILSLSEDIENIIANPTDLSKKIQGCIIDMINHKVGVITKKMLSKNMKDIDFSLKYEIDVLFDDLYGELFGVFVRPEFSDEKEYLSYLKTLESKVSKNWQFETEKMIGLFKFLYRTGYDSENPKNQKDLDASITPENEKKVFESIREDPELGMLIIKLSFMNMLKNDGKLDFIEKYEDDIRKQREELVKVLNKVPHLLKSARYKRKFVNSFMENYRKLYMGTMPSIKMIKSSGAYLEALANMYYGDFKKFLMTGDVRVVKDTYINWKIDGKTVEDGGAQEQILRAMNLEALGTFDVFNAFAPRKTGKMEFDFTISINIDTIKNTITISTGEVKHSPDSGVYSQLSGKHVQGWKAAAHRLNERLYLLVRYIKSIQDKVGDFELRDFQIEFIGFPAITERFVNNIDWQSLDFFSEEMIERSIRTGFLASEVSSIDQIPLLRDLCNLINDILRQKYIPLDTKEDFIEALKKPEIQKEIIQEFLEFFSDSQKSAFKDLVRASKLIGLNDYFENTRWEGITDYLEGFLFEDKDGWRLDYDLSAMANLYEYDDKSQRQLYALADGLTVSDIKDRALTAGDLVKVSKEIISGESIYKDVQINIIPQDRLILDGHIIAIHNIKSFENRLFYVSGKKTKFSEFPGGYKAGFYDKIEGKPIYCTVAAYGYRLISKLDIDTANNKITLVRRDLNTYYNKNPELRFHAMLNEQQRTGLIVYINKKYLTPASVIDGKYLENGMIKEREKYRDMFLYETQAIRNKDYVPLKLSHLPPALQIKFGNFKNANDEYVLLLPDGSIVRGIDGVDTDFTLIKGLSYMYSTQTLSGGLGAIVDAAPVSFGYWATFMVQAVYQKDFQNTVNFANLIQAQEPRLTDDQENALKNTKETISSVFLWRSADKNQILDYLYSLQDNGEGYRSLEYITFLEEIKEFAEDKISFDKLASDLKPIVNLIDIKSSTVLSSDTLKASTNGRIEGDVLKDRISVIFEYLMTYEQPLMNSLWMWTPDTAEEMIEALSNAYHYITGDADILVQDTQERVDKLVEYLGPFVFLMFLVDGFTGVEYDGVNDKYIWRFRNFKLADLQNRLGKITSFCLFGGQPKSAGEMAAFLASYGNLHFPQAEVVEIKNPLTGISNELDTAFAFNLGYREKFSRVLHSKLLWKNIYVITEYAKEWVEKVCPNKKEVEKWHFYKELFGMVSRRRSTSGKVFLDMVLESIYAKMPQIQAGVWDDNYDVKLVNWRIDGVVRTFTLEASVLYRLNFNFKDSIYDSYRTLEDGIEGSFNFRQGVDSAVKNYGVFYIQFISLLKNIAKRMDGVGSSVSEKIYLDIGTFVGVSFRYSQSRWYMAGGKIGSKYKAHYELNFEEENTIKFRDKVFRLYCAFLEGMILRIYTLDSPPFSNQISNPIADGDVIAYIGKERGSLSLREILKIGDNYRRDGKVVSDDLREIARNLNDFIADFFSQTDTPTAIGSMGSVYALSRYSFVRGILQDLPTRAGRVSYFKSHISKDYIETFNKEVNDDESYSELGFDSDNWNEWYDTYITKSKQHPIDNEAIIWFLSIMINKDRDTVKDWYDDKKFGDFELQPWFNPEFLVLYNELGSYYSMIDAFK